LKEIDIIALDSKDFKRAIKILEEHGIEVMVPVPRAY